MKPEREDLYITVRYIIYDRIIDIRSIGKLFFESFDEFTIKHTFDSENLSLLKGTILFTRIMSCFIYL